MEYLQDEFGVRYALSGNPTLALVGRSRGSDIVLPPLPANDGHRTDLSYLFNDNLTRNVAQEKYRSVSRQHAILRKQWGRFFLKDTDSSCGTFVDEKRLTGDLEAELTDGAKIRFGDLNLVYHNQEQSQEKSGEK